MVEQSNVLMRLQPRKTAAFGSLRVLALIPVVVGEMAWGLRQSSHDEAILRAVAQREHAPFWWSHDSPAFTLAMVLGLIGLAMTRLVCDASLDKRPRVAWGLIWGLAVMMTGANIASRAAITGGYADATGVIWLRRDEVVDRRSWSQATGLAVGCTHKEGRRSGGLYDRVLYNVEIGGRWVRLGGWQVGWSRLSVARWVANAQSVEKILPADIGVERGGLDARCLRYYGRHLYEPELKGFIRLLRPTPQQVASLIEKDRPVGRTVAEIAAER